MAKADPSEIANHSSGLAKYGKPIQRMFSGTLDLQVEYALRGKDITIFIESRPFVQRVNTVLQGEVKEASFPQTIDLFGSIRLGPYEIESARIHAALCFGTTNYSVTIRSDKGGDQPWELADRPLVVSQSAWTPGEWSQVSNYLHLALDVQSLEQPNDNYLTDAYSIAEIIFSAGFASETSGGVASSGLVLITGGTGSGKTTVLNGLIAKLLYHRLRAKPERRPHIVATGDPVETLFYKAGRNLDAAPQVGPRPTYASNPVDYTARILGTDVSNVSQALRDALRETTAVYVISELRDEDDFVDTLKFAATGQLVMATAHNTSLVDALRKLMTISKTSASASQRSLLAQRLHSVVHLQPMVVDGKRLTLPTVWLGNSSGVRNFVCDGLGSILPRDGGKLNAGGERRGSVGYAWAVEQLIANDKVARWQKDPQKREEICRLVKRNAHEMDLRIR